MKVFDLLCANKHVFEGWFRSSDDYETQHANGLISCPMCGNHTIQRRPSAARLNLLGLNSVNPSPNTPPNIQTNSAAVKPTQAQPTNPQSDTIAEAAALQQIAQELLKTILDKTENVGQHFAEEARKIHYGESPERAIRGQTTIQEAEALAEEGIEFVTLPVPSHKNQTLQ